MPTAGHPILMLFRLVLLLAALCKTIAASGTACVACGLVITIFVETKQVASICGDDAPCHLASAELRDGLRSHAPDELCSLLKLCNASLGCTLFPNGAWPPQTLPAQPPHVPVNDGRRLSGHPTWAVTVAMKHDAGLRSFKAGFLKLLDATSSSQGSGTFFDAFSTISNALARLHGVGQASPSAKMVATALAAKAKAEGVPASLQGQRRVGVQPCSPLNVSCILDRFITYKLPLSDRDDDAFSTTANRGLRGSHWRGADCNDRDASVYPGRKARAEGVARGAVAAHDDHDCNGISGSNASGSFEAQLCDGFERRGLIHIGDSATAHFHLPPSWLTATGWDGVNNGFANAQDELDWPQCAWGTGYKNASECPFSADVSMSDTLSLAGRLRQRNRCNHRDFQNVGVNGARIGAIISMIEGVARTPELDHPALAIVSLIGNDVCNGHADTFKHMTTPEQFRNRTLNALAALDRKLPNGSFVLLVGLVDGRPLYDTLHGKTHPIGTSYPDVYKYLTCNGANPCNGWLSTNATLRNLTTAWAQRLSAEHKRIADAPQHFTNFEVGFFQPDLRAIFDDYVKTTGNDPRDLIEPSDGFHPSQLANALLARQLWDFVVKTYPQAVGPENPNNAEIERLFGNQGGF